MALSIDDCPESPGCPALILRDERELDNTAKRAHYSARRVLKLFTEEGVERFAQVYAPDEVGGFNVRNLSGRSILPDGRLLPLEREHVSTKILRKGRRWQKVKRVTFPGLVPGAIVEYSFKVLLEPHTFVTENVWNIQQHLPILESRFTLKQGKIRMNWVQTGIDSVDVEHTQPTRRSHLLVTRKVPPIPREPFGPTDDAIRARYYFFLPELQEPWLGIVAGAFAGIVGRFIEPDERIAAEVDRLISGSDSTSTKIKTIYKYVQEEIGTEEERIDDDAVINERETAGDIIERGFGNEAERTMLFLAMARQAGLEPALMLIVSRFNGTLDRRVPDLGQFDAYAAALKIGAGWRFYDPATKHCPLGMLAAENEVGDDPSAVLIVPDKTAGKEARGRARDLHIRTIKPVSYTIVPVPVTRAARNMLKRELVVRLGIDGGAEVSVREQGAGHADLELSRTYGDLEADEQERTLAAKLRDDLPQAELVSASFEHLDSFEEKAEVSYVFRAPDLTTVAGDRILVMPAFLTARRSNPLVAETRRLPVHFPYAQKTQDKISFRVPGGTGSATCPLPSSSASLRSSSRCRFPGGRRPWS